MVLPKFGESRKKLLAWQCEEAFEHIRKFGRFDGSSIARPFGFMQVMRSDAAPST